MNVATANKHHRLHEERHRQPTADLLRFDTLGASCPIEVLLVGAPKQLVLATALALHFRNAVALTECGLNTRSLSCFGHEVDCSTV
jgi:hypothetical protein